MKRARELFVITVMLLVLITADVRGQSADGFDPNANGPVAIIVVQPDGKVLIGGDFTTLSPNGGGTVTRNHIARLNPDGTLDTAFNPNADFGLHSIAVQADGKILAGGGFTSIGGQTRIGIARLDATTGLADSFDPNADFGLYSIAVQADGKILAGGGFTSIGGQTRNHIARLDATTGLADSFAPNANDLVFSVAVQADGKILACGLFTSIGGQTRNRIARLDATAGLADSFDPNANRDVDSIVVQPDGKILAGGFFNGANSIGGQTRNRIARLDATSGLADSFDPNADQNNVLSIAVQADGKILAGGGFTVIGGQQRLFMARLDAATGLADSFNPNPDGEVESIAVQADGKILAGGSFSSIGGQPRNYIARLQIDAPTPTPTPVATPTPTPAATPMPPVITSPLMAAGMVGQPFVYQYGTSGATSVAVTNPPPGLTLNPALSAIVGNPSAAGTFQVGLSATNSAGTTSATLIITIQPAPSLGPVIISGTAATGRTGLPFSFHVITTGGSPSARLSVSDLPPGLTYDPVSGLISGTPTSDGSFAVTLTVTDGTVTTSSILQLTFTSDPAVPVIISPDRAALTPGEFFSYTINAPSNADPFSNPTIFTLIGTLPSGLSFDAATGTISGIYAPPLLESAKGGPGQPELAGGALLGSVQLFATNSHGTSTIRLEFLPAPSGAVNIATRLSVGTSENVLIGGFIITGNAPKVVLIRALGPSTGVPGALQDPTLELHDGANPDHVVFNDNWRDSQQDLIIGTTIPPTDDRESAIVVGLDPGSYTAIVAGKNGATGIALVEVYDLGTGSLDASGNAKLANIATRGFVDTGNNVMIGGFIIHPQAPATSTRVLIRAIGPSLTAFGIAGALQDPTLELHDGNGATLMSNDDWQSSQQAEIEATGLAPTDIRESAIVTTLPTGSYTAIVSGKDNTTGVAVVEAYVLE